MSQKPKIRNGFEKLIQYDVPKYGRRGEAWQSASQNYNIYLTLTNQVIAMYTNRFKWHNLPETCDSRFLEMVLFNQGVASISKNPENGLWYTLQMGGMTGTPDQYGYPHIWESLGVDGRMRYNTTKADGIYVYDNSLRAPIFQRVNLWVRELVDILTTMRQQRAHLKIPVIISGIQDRKMDLENYVKQIAGGEVFIITTTNGLENIDVKVQNPQNRTHSFLSELWENYFNIWNEIYKSGGIEYVDFKKERRVEAEIAQQNEPTNLIALDSLKMRRDAVNYLNNHFFEFKEKPIEVTWNYDNVTKNQEFMTNLPMLFANRGQENEFAGISGI